MPWLVMFFLKLSFLERDGSITISRGDFLKLVNKVYKLSNELLDTPPETFMLMMRAMVVQQIWYQVPVVDSWRQLMLQRILLERSFAVNNELFYNRVGITLDDYYKIANYLLTISGDKKPNAVIVWSMTAFYSHLSPALSDEVLVNFLKLVSLPFNGLAEFMRPYAVKDCNSAELYQETPFKNKPIIIENDSLVIFNAGLCVSGLRTIAMDVLKGCRQFYAKFGFDVEEYIGERLRRTPVKVFSMLDLNKVIPIKVGKIADYVAVDGNDVFVFESKAITPSVLMRCAYDPTLLSELLKESFIKGIEQGQETAFKLSGAEEFKNKRIRIVVVTLEEFYIYGGEYVSQYIKEGFEEDLVQRFGCLPVHLKDVIYMTLKDFLTLTEWLADKPMGSMADLFNGIEKDSNEPEGVRFSISPYIAEKIGSQVTGTVGVGDVLDRTQVEMQQLLTANAHHRKSQHPADFIRAFEKFRKLLQDSFS